MLHFDLIEHTRDQWSQSPMSITCQPVTTEFAVEIGDLDLRHALSTEDAITIERQIDSYGVAIFHNQPLSDEQQIAFSLNFGELETTEGGSVTRSSEKRLGPGLADVSNLDQSNRPYQRNDRRRLFNLGNRLWHSDSSFRKTPAKYSILSAREIYTTGGNTEFADMCAAYDALDSQTKDKIEDLVCEHSLLTSRGKLGFTEFSDEDRALMQPVHQRLVRRHPVTGRKSLYVASHIGTIMGWPVAEARCFINDLTEHATQREFVYVHQWQQYDLLVWDNRQTMHRVRAFDESQPRDMRRTTIAGNAPTITEEEMSSFKRKLESA